jgi:hypothetical protein
MLNKVICISPVKPGHLLASSAITAGSFAAISGLLAKTNHRELKIDAVVSQLEMSTAIGSD